MRGRARRPDRRGDRRRGDRADPRRRRRRRAAARRAGASAARRRPWSRPTPPTYGPADVAREIAAVVRATRPRARPTTWSCSATTPPTAATSRSASGSPTSSAGRSSTAPSVVAVADGVGDRAAVDGPDGHETYQVPLPAVVTVLEGGVEPRYPTVPGRMKAKKVAIEERAPSRRAGRPGAGPADCCRRRAVQRADPRQGRRRRARRRRPVREAGGAGPMILVLVEKTSTAAAVEVSLRGADLRPRRCPPRAAACPSTRSSSATPSATSCASSWRRTASATVHALDGDGRRGVRRRRPGPPAILSRRASSEVGRRDGRRHARGNEVMAHVAARAGVAMAANVLSFDGLGAVRGHPPGGRWRGAGGDACSTERPAVFTVAGHAVEADAGRDARRGRRRRARRPRSPPPTWSRGWSRPRSPSPTSPAR